VSNSSSVSRSVMLLTLLGWSKIISSVVDPVCFVDTIAYDLLEIG
jgi:hypothetical protein